MPALTHLSADAAPEEIVAVLARDGALILDDALPLDEVDALVAELEPYVEATPTGGTRSPARRPRGPEPSSPARR
jgi:hypothetical protein